MPSLLFHPCSGRIDAGIPPLIRARTSGRGARHYRAGGIYFAVFGALWYGALDAGQHAILRLMLRGRGAIPSRLPRFLDYGTRLIFLQRVGGGYRFVHGSLMEHIAGRAQGGSGLVGPVSPAARS